MRFRRVVLAGVLSAVAVSGTVGAATTVAIEKATITVTPPVRSIEADSTVHGAITGGDFETQRLQVDLTETMQGSASGVAKTAAKYATGYVVFNHVCGPQPLPGYPCQPTPTVPAGNWLWNTAGTMTYVLMASVSCFCGESVPVRAWSPGTIGNAPAKSISLYITTIGFTPFESAYNPAPIAGGTNATSSPVVVQSDLDAVRASVMAQLTTDLESALEAKAGNLRYNADSPVITTTADHGAGAETGTFHVTASGSLGAIAFSDAEVRALMAKALADAIPAGWHLVTPVSIEDYVVQFTPVQGNVTVTGAAHGQVAKEVDGRYLPARLRGLDSRAAANLVETLAPGSAVEIRITPFPAPWLPVNPDHIVVVVQYPT